MSDSKIRIMSELTLYAKPETIEIKERKTQLHNPNCAKLLIDSTLGISCLY